MELTAAAPGTDEAVASKAAAGDRAAFAELHRRFADRVWSMAKRMTGDANRADDITQDVFRRALGSLAAYDPSRKFSSWLLKIATNRIVDDLTRRRLWTGSGGADEAEAREPDPAAAALLEEDAERVRRALQAVPHAPRIVLLLFFQERLGYDEIAEMLGVSVNVARVRMFRGLRHLREELSR
jgi:RNA polymerase sigma-70 factor (ECF subfamily)